MRYDILLASLITLADLSGASQAQSRSDLARPVFDSIEVGTIGRNALLFAIIDKDPWLVRRILDAVAEQGGVARVTAKALGIDPDANPDLMAVRRDAAGSVQWIDLLKRAKAEKEGSDKAKPRIVPDNRSAEGSIELIDLAKRLKAQKAAK